ncbi:MAG: ATP-binding protein [Gammaproteobacteria bacterium]|nr:ATP-binding protein [Gammaproteobacteria bacterium]
MLIEFSVANFKSIRDRQTLSMVASKNKGEAKVHTFSPGSSAGGDDIKLLPAAAIYGPNAAGKSNLLYAFRTMAAAILESASEKHRGDPFPVTPFMLDSATQNLPSEFEVFFVVDEVRYQYGFAATRRRVMEEWMRAYPNNRPQRWFSRMWDKKGKKYDWFFGSSFSGEKNLWKKSTRDNALFLSTAVQLNSRQLQPAYDWFRNFVHFAGIGGFDETFSASLCETGKKQEVLNYLRVADLDIDDIHVKETPFQFPKGTPSGIKRALAGNVANLKKYDIQTTHLSASGEPVVFDFDEESDGTQKFFSLTGPWIDSLKRGHVLFIDELHNSMHPDIVEFLVRMFNNKKTNPRRAQLVFTTHETSIMDQNVLRRDQVWFCEKDGNQATRVYPLTDFRPRKGRDNLRLAYLSGSYGAVPNIRMAHG